MASLKDVKMKISGVKKTKQITKAMNMVASAKLRGAQNRIEHFRLYADRFEDMLRILTKSVDEDFHPLMTSVEKPTRTVIVLITSDRGLCGSFNMNIITHALKFADLKRGAGGEVSFYCVGKKGRDAIRKTDYPIIESLIGEMGTFDFNLAHRIAMDMMDPFMKGAYDEVFMAFAEFASLGKQTPDMKRVIPVVGEGPEPPEDGAPEEEEDDWRIYEPGKEALLLEILPRFVKIMIYRSLLDNSASEHAARMTAMDNATRNCDDMSGALILLFNKTRQAAITRDLMDIVGGAEALAG